MAETWAGRKVFVTGAEGFIGSWLTERLLNKGAEVVVLRRGQSVAMEQSIGDVAGRCLVVNGDLSSHEALLEVMSRHGVTDVFHLAAQAIVNSANHSPLSTFETNVRGTWNLLEASRLTSSIERIVVTSSVKTRAGHTAETNWDDANFVPSLPYDASKAAVEVITRSYAESFGLPVAVTRFANVFGGGDFNFSRLVPSAVRSLLAGESPVILSNGAPERDFIYIEDAIDAYLAVASGLSDRRNHGLVFNAGSDRPLSVLELITQLIAVAGSDLLPEIRGTETSGSDVDRQHLDSSLISERLGWAPSWSLADGLAETYRWYERVLPASEIANVG
ncbi:MAG: SDR family NAD(P)-dependent oxidoreductase [Thermoleophilaceae bacterium]|nr:SDR family NAD(P)-dependent oxidoreductase [Thermoleophilaceae bacterium]